MTKPIVSPKKLIEVALPLEEINKAAAREKSIRHGHPSTLHLWWARRPLAAARAVLFAQLVNDPSWKYSEEELKRPAIKGAITKRRRDLFRLLADLVRWESSTDADILSRARREIAASWRETCEANADHPDAERLFDPRKIPEFHDPFAGGGAIPLEAQRLGLPTFASDLNPVAVLINKAMVEFPPRFVDQPPIGPIPVGSQLANATQWLGTKGLGEDVRRYGALLREEASARIGELYPPIKITKEMARTRPDLQPLVGETLTVIAWIWARTVASPNPAAHGRLTPLVTSLFLSRKEKREAWLQLTSGKSGDVTFTVQVGPPPTKEVERISAGTRSGKAQDFVCVHTGTAVTREYARDEGKAGRMGEQLMAIALEGARGRVYLSPHDAPVPRPTAAQSAAAAEARRTFLSGATPTRAMITGGVCSAYGLTTWGSLFSDRQLTFLQTASELVDEVRQRIERDAIAAGRADAAVYAEAVATYLGFALSRSIDRGSSLCSWDSSPKMEALRNTFGRQALPMVWDFAEGNPFSSSSGSWANNVDWVSLVVERFAPGAPGEAFQADAQSVDLSGRVISADPPYYDNISYAELADFFYIWLRKTLVWERRRTLTTLLTPKDEELVAAPHRHGGAAAADAFFLDGMTAALERMATSASLTVPITIYYAFKQSETNDETGTASTGWETFLEAALRAGLELTGTWPMRTELGSRLVGKGANALASSIVLVFRPRPKDAATIARREFLKELDRALPAAIAEMIADPTASIAPVDLAQAVIGPGMAVFSKYAAVVEADGKPMSVRTALTHINKVVDEFFAEAEGALDRDTLFCITWFEQHRYETQGFDEADKLARAKGTAVSGLEEAGVIKAGKGKARLLKVSEYPADWDPKKDARTPTWEALHQMSRALQDSESTAGALLARMPERTEAIRSLAYRLYTLCERKGWAEDARAYNDLITSWPAIVEESLKVGHKGEQMGLV